MRRRNLYAEQSSNLPMLKTMRSNSAALQTGKTQMTISTQATVERMFSRISHRRGALCQNPVTAGWFVFGEDPIGVQKEAACKALLARDWFAENGPPDAPPLPLNYCDRETMKGRSPLESMVSLYARSLATSKYDFNQHPSFYDFVCGAMALDTFWHDDELKKRFPPRPLNGLQKGFIWKAAEHNNTRRLQ
jgi:hypothetical protein